MRNLLSFSFKVSVYNEDGNDLLSAASVGFQTFTCNTLAVNTDHDKGKCFVFYLSAKQISLAIIHQT